MRKSEKKSGKKGETWSKVVDNVKVQFNGLCAFSNMVIKVNIARKSEKIRKKIEIYDVDHTMLVYCLHGLCAFPNMVSSVNLMRKSGIIRRKE